MNAPRQEIQGNWRQFLRLGEQLLKQATATDQIALIAELVKEKTGCDSRVWLAKPFYPLPGEPEIETLPNEHAPALVNATHQHHNITYLQTDGAITRRSRQNNVISLAIPLVTQSSLLGVLEVMRCDPEAAIPAEEMDYLIGLASHAAVNMQISRQVALKNWRYDQLNLISAVSDQISNITDLDQLCRQVTQSIAETFAYNYVAIFTLSDEGEKVDFRASAGASKNIEEHPGFSISFEDGLIGFAAKNNLAVYAPDVDNDPRYRYIESLGSTRSEMVLPIQVAGKLLGILDIQSNQLDGLHEVDRLVLHTLADSIAIGIHGARLLANLQWKVDQLEAILEVSHKLTSILDFDRLISEVVDSLHKRFGYPFIHMFTVHSGRRKVIFHAGSGARSSSLAAIELAYDLDDPHGIIPLVARSGKSYLANDVATDALYRPSPLSPSETLSELAVPVMVGEEVLGVLDIQSDDKDAFDDSDVSLFEALAGTIAISLHNANLYRAEQWRREVAVGFRDVAEQVSSGDNLDGVMNTILEQLDALLPCEASAIWLFPNAAKNGGDPQEPLLLAACHGVDSTDVRRHLNESPELQAWFKHVIALPNPTIRSQEDMVGPLGATLGYARDYSSLAAPLRAGDESLGLLTLAHSTPGRYGSEARSITATFASYAAMAIRDARLFASAQEQAWISTILLQVANACQTSESVEELMETITRLLPLLIGVHRSAFLLWEEHHNAFRFHASYGFERTSNSEELDPVQYPALQNILRNKGIEKVENPDVDLALPGLALGKGNSEEAIILLPLVSRGRLLGAYLIGYPSTNQTTPATLFGEETHTFLQGIAHQVSTALENLQLVETRQQEGYVTAALLQVAQAVVTQTDLPQVLDTIIHLLPILLGMDTGAIYLWNETEQVFDPVEVYASNQADEDFLRSRRYHQLEYDLLKDSFQKDRIAFIPMTSPDTPPQTWHELSCVHAGEDNRLSDFAGQTLVLAIPLSAMDERFGVFVIKERPTPPGIQEKRFEMLSGIAQQISLAIQNARYQRQLVEQQTLEREMAFAREIQQNFLPEELPKPAGWEVSAKWQTARTVGGDFYDIFYITPDTLGLVIADVADKGLPASLYMTVTRTLIRSYLTPEASPSEVLKRVNQALFGSSRTAMFVTVVLAVLDLRNGELVYTNAGHNRPVLRNAEKKTAHLMPKGGIALGVSEDAMLVEKTFTLEPGDCLLFYTDGVTEAIADNGEFFGEGRLVRLVKQAAGEGVERLLERLDAALAEFRHGTAASDDMTLLVIGRCPSPSG